MGGALKHGRAAACIPSATTAATAMSTTKYCLPALVFCFLSAVASAEDVRWKLVWEDNFAKDDFIDPAKWVKIGRGRSDWNRHMSADPACYAVKDGRLVLKGIRNPDAADPVKVITGGVTTNGKFEFTYGKVEIRAKLGTAKGAWPAFWMLSNSRKHGGYPHSGEIDIMEHLNSDRYLLPHGPLQLHPQPWPEDQPGQLRHRQAQSRRVQLLRPGVVSGQAGVHDQRRTQHDLSEDHHRQAGAMAV